MTLLTSLLLLLQAFSGYLFVYFTGNKPEEETIHYAISYDGFNYRALNGNKAIMDSRAISRTGGVRDPHILRGEDGRTFYMVCTDMTSELGWDSNRGMVLLKSTDLVNWSHSAIDIQKTYAGQDSLKRVWAPQTIYDRKAGKYLIYWSMKHGIHGTDIIYYAYANSDFTALEGEPKVFFTPRDSKSCIDGDIVEKDGIYHLFYKTEGHGNGIKVATATDLTADRWTEEPDYKQQTEFDVEGAGTFRLIGEDRYVLMYDCYMKKQYHFTTSTDLSHFSKETDQNMFDFKPRHGTVIAITADEMERVCKAYGNENQKILAWSDPYGGGLRLAWSIDGKKWAPLGEDVDFLSSDFGSWSSGKKMYGASLSRSNGLWTCRFKVTESGEVSASTSSADLIHWKPQSYDNSSIEAGTSINAISCRELCTLADHVRKVRKDKALDKVKLSELMAPQNVSLRVKVQPGNAKAISSTLYGIFFEDINNSADGGLYAELVRNRDFEFSSRDRSSWTPTKGWDIAGGAAEIRDSEPLHANNAHYLHIDGSVVLENRGWDGIHTSAGEKFNFSLFSRGKAGVKVELVAPDGSVLAGKSLNLSSSAWKRSACSLSAASACDNASLRLSFSDGSSIDADLISLFPQKTFKGHGLRQDLAQTLADMKPAFVRFPGGCVAHGNGIDNIYDWKGSIGPIEGRKHLRNLWGYHQTRGLGYFEYFQFCEDIGAEPLPVLAAGVPCQNSDHKAHHSVDELSRYGQQQGIPMEEMGAYIQDILDLIEYANGPASSKWGSKRAAAGHPKPFNLKYIGIGNEDMITPVFKERFEMIHKAVKEAHPEICVIGTVGPFHSGSDYDEGWAFAREKAVEMVDEHYYVSPNWFVHNRNFYDSYDRQGPGVYLGEYAAHREDRRSTMETALAVALYLTDVERNADIVRMSSFAPLLARRNQVQWEPDMIWFDSKGVYPTTDYYVQKMYGCNAGDSYLPSSIEFGAELDEEQRLHVGVSCVKDSASGDVILKLVNMLPSRLSLDIEGLRAGRCGTETLSGKPDSRSCDYSSAKERFDGAVTLAPYSVKVIRIKY